MKLTDANTYLLSIAAVVFRDAGDHIWSGLLSTLVKNDGFNLKTAPVKKQNLTGCTELFPTERCLSQSSCLKPLFGQRPLGSFFPNATQFALIQLHKVTPGSCSIQPQRGSAGAGGVKWFCQGHHHRGLPEKTETVARTPLPAQSWGGDLPSRANIFTFGSLKKCQRNFTD